MNCLYLIIAIIVIAIAHIVRIIRWGYFINLYERPKYKILFRALSLGYLINAFFPYKIGDVFRAIYLGKRCENGISLGFSTVIIERYIDILTMGIVFIILHYINSDIIIADTGLFYIFAFLLLFFLTCLIYIFKKYFKYLIVKIASVFNREIETSILVMAWTFIKNFIDIIKKVEKIKLLFITIVMWGLYFLSYYLFANFLKAIGVNLSFVDIMLNLFTKERIMNSDINLDNLNLFIYILYFIVPLLILYLISVFIKDISFINKHENVKIMPYINTEDKQKFLENYFNDSKSTNVKSFIEMNSKVTILKDLSGNSNATTILCMDANSIFYRKYAFGKDANILKKQLDYICKYKEKIKMPIVIRSDYEKNNYMYYDMSDVKGALNLFDYLHTVEIDECEKLFLKIFNDMESNVYLMNENVKNNIDSYIDEKIIGNIKKICNAKIFSGFIKFDMLIINGKKYKNIKLFDWLYDRKYLMSIFENDIPSIAHGDLTIENIIVNNSAKNNDYYIIDPNEYSDYQTKFLDYSKLLQSLHGKYEFLIRINSFETSDNVIKYFISHSKVYDDLYLFLVNYIEKEFGFKALRSIYLHELVHWLRLIPYAINKSGSKAIILFSKLIVLINEYNDRFYEK